MLSWPHPLAPHSGPGSCGLRGGGGTIACGHGGSRCRQWVGLDSIVRHGFRPSVAVEKKKKKNQWAHQMTIGGHRLIAHRQGQWQAREELVMVGGSVKKKHKKTR